MSKTPNGPFRTLAIDSGSELARLCFAWDMHSLPTEWEKLRAVNNYMGAGERLNKVMRRLKVARDEHGMEVVVICHEGLDKLYARGGMIAARGANTEPYAVKGRVDVPGQQTPEEMMRAADNVLRVRMLNGAPAWIAIEEPIGGGTAEPWEVKTRFNARAIKGGYLPASYEELLTAMAGAGLKYHGPFIWLLYGGIGKQKTLSLRTFPRPIRILDVDKGTVVLKPFMEEDPTGFHITQYNSEDYQDYERLILDLEEALDPTPSNIEHVRQELGKRKKVAQ